MGNSYVLPPTDRKGRGYTPELWRMSNFQEVQENPAFGVADHDDLFELSGWTKTNLNSASATFTNVEGVGGIGRLDPGATTQHHGGQVQKGDGFVQNAENVDLCWEALVRFSAIGTDPNALLGLGEVDTSMLSAAGAVAIDDFIGFNVVAGDGNIDFISVIGGSETRVADLFTGLTADTWLHLGFRVIGGKVAVPFINGVQYEGETQLINGITLLPDEELTHSFAITGNGTTQPTLDIDWTRVCSDTQANIRS